MTELDYLISSQRSHRVGVPLIVDKFDLGNRRGKQFDNGPNLTAHESLLGDVLKHCHLRKKLDFSHVLLAYRT